VYTKECENLFEAPNTALGGRKYFKKKIKIVSGLNSRNKIVEVD
jgi:hypothetical protein